jgi:hypothetical protein
MSKTTMRVADGKGRILLGNEFKGRVFLIQQQDDALILRPAVVLPEREAWLYRNEAALKSVNQGLEQARMGEFCEPPDMKAAARLAKNLPE